MAKRIIIVEENQSIFDIALQEYGAAEAVTQLVSGNNLDSVNVDVETNTELVITDNIINKDVVNLYIKKNIKPASLDQDNGHDDVGAFTDGFSFGFKI